MKLRYLPLCLSLLAAMGRLRKVRAFEGLIGDLEAGGKDAD